MNDALLSQIDMQPVESFHVQRRGRRRGTGFHDQTAGVSIRRKKVSAEVSDPRWAARGVGKFVDVSVERGVVRRAIFAAVGRAILCRAEIRNIAWRLDGVSPYQSKLALANGATDGYVVVMINFHGSTGYGQKFTDSISGDWGGKPYVDLMKGLDYVEKTYPFIDKNREAALGASYGGFMANWLLGQHRSLQVHRVARRDLQIPSQPTGRRRNFGSRNGNSKGRPWKQREFYRKFSPHLFADKFRADSGGAWPERLSTRCQ